MDASCCALSRKLVGNFVARDAGVALDPVDLQAVFCAQAQDVFVDVVVLLDLVVGLHQRGDDVAVGCGFQLLRRGVFRVVVQKLHDVLAVCVDSVFFHVHFGVGGVTGFKFVPDMV